jgi:putative OmpL-like beta-barrel porin-2
MYQGGKLDTEMRSRCRAGAAIAIAILLFASLSRGQEISSTSLSNETMIHHLEDLERQLKELRTEVATLKDQERDKDKNTGLSKPPEPAIAQSNLVSSTSPVQDRSPATAPSLAGMLGSTTLSGFVDIYYGQNFNNPASQTNSLRFFDGGTNQFGLNLVELVVDKAPEVTNSRTGYHVALGFGQAMNAVNGSDHGGLGFDQYLKEAYFSYLAPVGKGLQVDAGKFVTPHGAEVIETKDNWNYSRGLLFSYAIPYYHFGVRAKYAFNDKYSLSGFFVNGWNNVVDNNTGKTYGIGFGWNPSKKFGIVQNYMVGPEENSLNRNVRQLSDTVITYSPTSKLSFIVNGDYGRGDRFIIDPVTNAFSHPVFWTGVAGYVKYALNSHSAVATRYEYYDDREGFTTGTLVPTHFNEFTATFERLMAHHIISRFEFRRDMSNQPVFLKGSNPVLDQNTLTAGLVFTFDSREAK